MTALCNCHHKLHESSLWKAAGTKLMAMLNIIVFSKLQPFDVHSRASVCGVHQVRYLVQGFKAWQACSSGCSSSLPFLPGSPDLQSGRLLGTAILKSRLMPTLIRCQHDDHDDETWCMLMVHLVKLRANALRYIQTLAPAINFRSHRRAAESWPQFLALPQRGEHPGAARSGAGPSRCSLLTQAR